MNIRASEVENDKIETQQDVTNLYNILDIAMAIKKTCLTSQCSKCILSTGKECSLTSMHVSGPELSNRLKKTVKVCNGRE